MSFDRKLFAFSAYSASYYAHIGFFNPYLPLWLQDQGLSLMMISLLTSVQSATRLYAPYGWAWLGDRTGARIPLLRYAATAALVCGLGLLYPQQASWWLPVVLLLMFSHTSSMVSLSESALAQVLSKQGQFDSRRYGRVRLWGSLGFLATVFAAGAWFDRYGIADFPLWSTISLAALVLSTWALPNVREVHAAEARKQSIWPMLQSKRAFWFFTGLFFHGLAHMALYIYFSLYLDQLGFSKWDIGLLWGISVVAEILWFYTQGRWLPKMALSQWLMLASALAALRFGVTGGVAYLSHSWAFAVLLAMQCLHAFTFATHHSVCTAMLSTYFTGAMRSRGQALYTVIGYGATGVLAGLLGAQLTRYYSLQTAYYASALCAVVATFCVWRLRLAQLQNQAELEQNQTVVQQNQTVVQKNQTVLEQNAQIATGQHGVAEPAP